MKTLAVSLAVIVFNCISFAQSSAPAARTPGAPMGSYSLSEFDRVNLFSGNLNVSLPMLGFKGRGDVTNELPLVLETQWNLSVSFPGNGYTLHEYSATTPPPLALVGAVTARGSVNSLVSEGSCDPNPSTTIYWQEHQFNFSLVGPGGTETVLVDQFYRGRTSRHCGSLNLNYGNVFESTDGSFIKFITDGMVSTTNYAITGYLFLKNGMKSRVVNGKILWTQDRNGNRTEYTYDPNSSLAIVTKIKDSAGREIDIARGVTEAAPYGLCDKITYKGFGGAERVIRVSRDSLGNLLRTNRPGDSSSLKTIPELFTDYPDDDIVVGGGTSVFNGGPGVKALWLPDGRSYRFKYNVYGRVARVELPTGGAFEYDYDPSVGGVTGGVLGHVTNRVKEKRVYDENDALVETTRFTRIAGSGTIVDVEKFSPTEIRLSKTRHHFFGVAAGEYEYNLSWKDGKEFKTEVFSSNGSTVLRKVENEWKQRVPAWCYNNPYIPNICGLNPPVTGPSINSFIVETKTTLVDSNLVSSMSSVNPANGEWSFDAFNNPTDVWYYDYGSGQSGALIKRTHTDYLTDSNYLDLHFHSLPTQTWISSDSAGANIVSLTQFEYDNYINDTNHAALVNRSNVIGHDITNYGSTNTKRGNVTKITTYGNASTQTGAISVYSQYDVLGNVVKTIDARGYSSTISYADKFGSPDGEVQSNTSPTQLGTQSTFSFPTSATNALGTIYSQFDYFTGQPVNTEDVNGIISKTVYNDPLDRPTQSVSAVGLADYERQSNTIYDDANKRIETRTDLNVLDDNLLKSESLYDGLGRTIESRKYEAGGGYVATKSVPYLVMQDPQQTSQWRIGAKTSNPYRPGAGEQPVWITSLSDELGRTIKVITPDGAIVKTEYSGNATTVTDQAEKQRRSITNAVGQLIRVDEANNSGQLGSIAAPNQPTYYNFNALGKMIHVQQGVQNRYFMYDSLGRLLRVKQPEQDVNTSLNTSGNPGNNSWTAGFTYDDNGNVLTAKDAKNITITNTYDQLNRPLSRSYSDGTPTVTNYYDGAGLPSVPSFSKGKLTRVSSSVSDSRYTDFDPVGRLEQFQQITDGQTYTSNYEYNLSGALTKETYPSGRVVQNEFDANGDLSKIFGRATTTSIERIYASNFFYSTDGKIEKLKLGSGVWESAKFNSRLQVTELSVGWGPTSGSIWKMQTEYGELQTDGTVDATKNSGSIGKQTVSFTGLANPFVQNFKYDSLYRLTEAKETNNSNQIWKQNFTYDRYGNRLTHQKYNGTTETTQTDETHPAIDSTSNRFAATEGYTFDANGNVIIDFTGRQFTFNGDNKQTEVKTAANKLVGKYFYDGEGKRVKKLTYTPNGDPKDTTVFVYSGGKLIAEYTTEAPPETPTTRFTITDQLGSPRVILDSAGDVVSRRDFLPFGEEIAPDETYRKTDHKYGETDYVRQKFTGYEHDEETGLDFAEARMYENRHGRFTAVDPLLASGKSDDPQTFNRYVYVMNNPLVLTDPMGLQAGTAGYWTYRDTTANGQTTRSFRFFRNEQEQETVQAVIGGDSYQRWNGGNFYVFANDTAVHLPESGNAVVFSTRSIATETLVDAMNQQSSGGSLSSEQSGALMTARLETLWRSAEYKAGEATAGIAGSLGASLTTFGTNYFLRNVAFGTSRNGAVFFSGSGTAAAADQFAVATGRQTISMTPGGKVLESVTGANVFGRPAYEVFPRSTQRLWGWGSRYFAQGASGEVNVFRQGTAGFVWSQVEAPILQQNKNVIFNFRRVPATKP